MSSCEIHCTLKDLSKGKYSCYEDCKLRSTAALPRNGLQFIAPPCEVLAEDLVSIRRSLNFSDEKLAELINDPYSDLSATVKLENACDGFYLEE
jgi:hypothetical protein